MRRLLLTVLGAMIGVLVSSPAAADYLHEQVERQTQFAKEELAEGQYDRALKSAESALRLDPEFHQALLLKALAYEGLGDKNLARSLVAAWQEANPGQGLPPEGAELLERLVRSRGRPQERSARIIDLSDRGTAARIADLAPEPYRDRSQSALAAGRCEAARAAATEFLRYDESIADGWRLLGDAERCADHKRAAVLAYERYGVLGGTEGTVSQLIEGLRADLATLTVHVLMKDKVVTPKVQVVLPDGSRANPTSRDRITAKFADLPPRVGLEVIVAGRGLEAVRQQIEALPAGGEGAESITPVVVGIGRVRAEEFDDTNVSVTILTADEEATVGSGATREVTAGSATAVIGTERGAVEVPIEVPRDGEVVLSPAANLPSALTVIGLPSNSDVRVRVRSASGVSIDRTLQIPRELGEIDERSGLRIAPPQLLEGLPGGSASIRVSHPVLGERELNAVLENGASNATTFKATEMAGADRVRTAYENWLVGARSTSKKRQSGAVALGVGSGLLLAGGGALLGLSQIAANERIQPALVCGAWRHRDPGYEGAACVEAAAVQRQQEAMLAGGSALIGVGLAGVTVSIALGAKARTAGGAEGEWDPWDSE